MGSVVKKNEPVGSPRGCFFEAKDRQQENDPLKDSDGSGPKPDARPPPKAWVFVGLEAWPRRACAVVKNPGALKSSFEKTGNILGF